MCRCTVSYWEPTWITCLRVPQRETSRFHCSFYRLRWHFFSLIRTWDSAWEFLSAAYETENTSWIPGRHHILWRCCGMANVDLHTLLSPLPGLRWSSKHVLPLYTALQWDDFNSAIAQGWNIWIDSHWFFFPPHPTWMLVPVCELLQCESVWAITEGSEGQFRDVLT